MTAAIRCRSQWKWYIRAGNSNYLRLHTSRWSRPMKCVCVFLLPRSHIAITQNKGLCLPLSNSLNSKNFCLYSLLLVSKKCSIMHKQTLQWSTSNVNVNFICEIQQNNTWIYNIHASCRSVTATYTWPWHCLQCCWIHGVERPCTNASLWP